MVPRCKMCGEPWFGDPGRACNPCVKEHNDRLNGEVTEAILKAERALDEAIRCWEDVEKVETSLTICVKDEDERDVAQRGVGTARTIVAVLKALRG